MNTGGFISNLFPQKTCLTAKSNIIILNDKLEREKKVNFIKWFLSQILSNKRTYYIPCSEECADCAYAKHNPGKLFHYKYNKVSFSLQPLQVRRDLEGGLLNLVLNLNHHTTFFLGKTEPKV